MTQDKAAEREFFDAVTDHYDHYFERDLLDQTISIMVKRKLWFGSSTVMEAGCGTGLWGRSFIRDRRLTSFDNCITVTGVDLSERMVEVANKGKPEGYNAVVGDLENPTTFAEGTFDVVLCPMVLHHFPDASKVMFNLTKWLKPGGKIIIIEPNGSNPVNAVSRWIRKLLELVMPTGFLLKYQLATPNETAHSIATYQRMLSVNQYAVLSTDTYTPENDEIAPWNDSLCLRLLFAAKLCAYALVNKVLPRSRFSGTVCMIVGQRYYKF